MYDAGVKVGFGTDTGPPGRFPDSSNISKCSYGGGRVTPTQIIQIGDPKLGRNSWAAKDLGTLENGKWADLIVFRRIRSTTSVITHDRDRDDRRSKGELIYESISHRRKHGRAALLLGSCAAAERAPSWAPKYEAAKYPPGHKPHTKLADLIAKNKGQANWSEVIVNDDHLHSEYIQSAPGTKVSRGSTRIPASGGS